MKTKAELIPECPVVFFYEANQSANSGVENR